MKIEKQNDGQLKIEIKVSQPRIDNAHQQEMTSFALVDRNGLQIVQNVDPSESVLGTVIITHPSIIWGTWEEFVDDISYTLISELKNRRLATTNRYGYTRLV